MFHIDGTLASVVDALERGDLGRAISILTMLHPADRGDVFLGLTPHQQRDIITKLDFSATAGMLQELREEDAAQVASELPSATLAQVLDEMEPENAADILGDLSEEQATSTLAHMDEASGVKPLLQYRDDTAGGLMSPVVISLESTMTADQAIRTLRESQLDSNSPYYLYVVNESGELQGVLPLRRLITADPSSLVLDLMSTNVKRVTADTDQEEIAKMTTRYGLLALPVVDETGKLIGTVGGRNVAEVIEAEATEDIYRLAGVSDAQIDIWSAYTKGISKRLPWLIVNLGTAFLAALVVSRFESTIQQLAVLAVFQGIIAGQGGNAGTQTLTLVVRGMALGEIAPRDFFSAVKRELIIAVVNGLVVGLAVAVGAYLWIGNAWLGAVAGLALLGNLLAAAVAGTFFPILLKMVKLDPALASGVLVTTVTDCVGFGLFLYLAREFLPWIKG